MQLNHGPHRRGEEGQGGMNHGPGNRPDRFRLRRIRATGPESVDGPQVLPNRPGNKFLTRCPLEDSPHSIRSVVHNPPAPAGRQEGPADRLQRQRAKLRGGPVPVKAKHEAGDLFELAQLTRGGSVGPAVVFLGMTDERGQDLRHADPGFPD
jgi:hypothetical protein